MTNNQLTDEQIENIIEMATDAAKRYGPQWDSALVGGAGGNFHAVTSDTIQAVVVQANDDSRDASWLCDYLESVSPAVTLSVMRELQERRKPDALPAPQLSRMSGIMPDYEGVAMTQRECYMAGKEAGLAEAGKSPVIPDGYTLVPFEPTEDMIINGFESEPDEYFSDEDVWAEYEKMSGCQKAAHRARLCWNAMLAAAPKLENI